MRHDERGAVPVAIIVGVVIVAIIVVILVATTQGRDVTPPSQVPGAENACFTYCIGVVEFQCGDNELMGACFGVWDCDEEIGVHECR